jgi:hypothetical protein
VQETGPTIVNDQPVTEFTAAVDPTKLAGWSKLLSTDGGGLTKELETKREQTTARLELFLSPAGVPVRIRFALQAAGAIATLTSDTLAFEVPVEVQAPPPREIIGDAQLKVLQKKQRERERSRFRRQLLRICRKLPAKEAAGCRRAARGKSKQ